MRPLIAAIAVGLLVAGCYQETQRPRDAYVPKTHAQQLNNQAMDALKADRNDEAVQLLSQAVEEDPRFAQAYVNKAVALGRLGRFEETLGLLATATQLEPDLADAYLFRGVFAERLQKTDDALNSYAKAATLLTAKMKETPAPDLATSRAIALYLGTGKVQGLEAFNAVLAQYPDYSRARFLREKIQQGDRAYFMWWVADQDSR